MEQKIVPLSGRVDALGVTVQEGLDQLKQESEATMEQKIVPLSGRVTELDARVQSVEVGSEATEQWKAWTMEHIDSIGE